MGEPSLDESLVIETLRPVIESEEIDKVGHNLKFDTIVLRSAGVVLGGRLIDTTVGERVPPGAELELPPTPEEVAELATPPLSELAKFVMSPADLRPNPASPVASSGVEECGVINLAASDDGFPAGPITGNWKHGGEVGGRSYNHGGGRHLDHPRRAASLFSQYVIG